MHFEQNVSIKSGLPPGIPIYIGEREPEPTKLSAISYSEETFIIEDDISLDKICEKSLSDFVCWVQVSGLKNTSLIEAIGERLKVHPLFIEDILNTKGRSKIEEFENYLFIDLNLITFCMKDSFSSVLPGAQSGAPFDFSKKDLAKQQVCILLFKNLVISFIEHDTPFQPIINRINLTGSRFRRMGADFLAYALIDTIVDRYFEVMEWFEDELDLLEDEVLTLQSPTTMHHIQSFRQDMIWFKRHVWSVRDLIIHMERTDTDLISSSTQPYLRDVYDHTIKLVEDMEIYRDMAESLMEIYLSAISNKTNEIMKVLTIIATIFIPLTFIAGLYGMNFRYMPELESPYSYPIVLLIMLSVALGMLIYFWKNGWIGRSNPRQ